MKVTKYKICVIGLGYVGLPLAVALSKKYSVVGFDINSKRVDSLKNNIDSTLELSSEELMSAGNILYTHKKEDIVDSEIYIVTVPTPIDDNNTPDLNPVIKASELLGGVISYNNIVIYESTVYPGATEEVCVPILRDTSGLEYNKEFFVGYSPERINPGDKNNRLENIKKVTSGSTVETANIVDSIYSSIINAGTFKASSIKVAESSKIIENVQRDVNIALINEFHQILSCLNINTVDVIEAASTKWNFMKLHPGLVGGHCISVDPYYLIHKSQSVGYIPDLIKKSREINNGMPSFVVNDFIKKLILNKINPIELKVVVLGFSFKPNCPDVRNTKVFDVYNLLIKNGFNVIVYDPIVDKEEVFEEYGIDVITSISEIDFNDYTVSFIGTEHNDFNELSKEFKFTYNFKS
ncbi:nucleotide sugar dehydrogenase [Shewanella sp. 5_MG-2023]|uniref:nucleotide sugar dehydrogenase n=1 Tax=Shewanella sp. 5_MG-2023 TaxID=3062656 RepID=UPI0026E38206|nr:nucleotide sugar dehydrogenase [Shewanella sp. 5_MG-2023]MDO6639191.1 nucleotide sugar dehydrogenase [Shewanella sp. 5_MG-2023]